MVSSEDLSDGSDPILAVRGKFVGSSERGTGLWMGALSDVIVHKGTGPTYTSGIRVFLGMESPSNMRRAVQSAYPRVLTGGSHRDWFIFLDQAGQPLPGGTCLVSQLGKVYVADRSSPNCAWLDETPLPDLLGDLVQIHQQVTQSAARALIKQSTTLAEFAAAERPIFFGIVAHHNRQTYELTVNDVRHFAGLRGQSHKVLVLRPAVPVTFPSPPEGQVQRRGLIFDLRGGPMIPILVSGDERVTTTTDTPLGMQLNGLRLREVSALFTLTMQPAPVAQSQPAQSALNPGAVL